MKRRQLTKPKPATSRSIANPLAAEPRGEFEEGNGSMDAGEDLGSAAKGLAIGLEAACSGLVSCQFFIPLIFLLFTMCSSL